MTIAVYCASSPGTRPIFMDAAREFGKRAAENGHTIVYGGGGAGLMGAVADGALTAGGSVTGVIPEAMVEHELAHTTLTELVVVPSMHVRKATMADRADAFVALPGGAGTMDELCEVWCWAQLGIHGKPIALYNIDNYFTPWLTFVDTMVTEGFVRDGHHRLVKAYDDVDDLISSLSH